MIIQLVTKGPEVASVRPVCIKRNGPGRVPSVPLLVCAQVEVIMRFLKKVEGGRRKTQNFCHVLVTGYGKRDGLQEAGLLFVCIDCVMRVKRGQRFGGYFKQ
ncbi:hypothetical protein NDU88_004728 [Pleurodeles waltl]|uniref:Uncharacterized protein n=1 Tax=Pleurodeles waltl TaxID=8319 RepID=A0AAV7M963_PLEWA|nr:hypothetical protein NDU88_004728 [Pleurodeles waltl]